MVVEPAKSGKIGAVDCQVKDGTVSSADESGDNGRTVKVPARSRLHRESN